MVSRLLLCAKGKCAKLEEMDELSASPPPPRAGRLSRYSARQLAGIGFAGSVATVAGFAVSWLVASIPNATVAWALLPLIPAGIACFGGMVAAGNGVQLDEGRASRALAQAAVVVNVLLLSAGVMWELGVLALWALEGVEFTF